MQTSLLRKKQACSRFRAAIDYFAQNAYDDYQRWQMATATEVENHFGAFMEKARHEPLIVEKIGQKYVVMLSYEEFERLQTLEDRLWALAAEEAEKSGYIGTEESMKLLMRD